MANHTACWVSTGYDELDSLMSGAGWATSDGNYGSTDDIYVTYSFFEEGSSYDYELEPGQTASDLSPLSAKARKIVGSAFDQIEKFTNLNFIEVSDTSSSFGDIRFVTASPYIMGDALGMAFFSTAERYGVRLDSTC